MAADEPWRAGFVNEAYALPLVCGEGKRTGRDSEK